MEASTVDAPEAGIERPDGSGHSTSPASRPDMRWSLRGFLVLDLVVRLAVWGGALALSVFTFNVREAWPDGSPTEADLWVCWQWAKGLARWVILFNLIYVAELVVLRLLIPTPREGRHSTTGRLPSRQVLWSALIGALTKARYQAPFPGFLVFHVANLPPLCWLMGPVFGPRSRSCYATEPGILDPHLVTIGRNVIIGFNAVIAGHHQDHDSIVFKRTIVEDDVVIGGNATIMGGVHIHSGAMISAGAVVLPNTVIGPNELWHGVPARRIRSQPPSADQASRSG